MNLYHGFADLKAGVSDLAFAEAFGVYMEHLKSKGHIEGWRLTRSKLGLGIKELGEFHFMIEFKDLAQLDRAFDLVSTRAGETEAVHHGVNSMIERVRFGLYRDFPDHNRKRGEERF
jgi:hypothetical protein